MLPLIYLPVLVSTRPLFQILYRRQAWLKGLSIFTLQINMIIAHKANKIFEKAETALNKTGITEFDDRMIFFIDNILDQLTENKSLLNFISKNLSWGIFKNVIRQNVDKKNRGLEEETEPYDVLGRLRAGEELKFKNKDVLVYMIVELVSSTCYSAILYNEPVSIEELKPYIFETVREMIRLQRIIK